MIAVAASPASAQGSSGARTMDRMNLENARPSARLIWPLALLIIYFGAFASGATRLISTLSIDSKWIEQAAEMMTSQKLEGSFAVMAVLYSHTSPTQRLLIEIFSGVLFILYCAWPLRTNRAFALLSFILIGPLLFFLMQFNKDTIVVFFVIAAAACLRLRLPLYIRLLLVSVIYVTYAHIFLRQYYYLIIVAFLSIVLIRRLGPLTLIPLFLLALAVAVLLPDHLFSQLQISRDLYNVDRIGRDLAGSRTAFGNIVPPTDLITFLINYAYAFARLNFPFFAGVTPRDIYLFANEILFACLVVIGLRGDSKTSDSAALFLSHVIALTCFEPDTGSYLRHLSSALPYLIPALIVLDRSWSVHEWLAPHAPARALAYPRR